MGGENVSSSLISISLVLWSVCPYQRVYSRVRPSIRPPARMYVRTRSVGALDEEEAGVAAAAAVAATDDDDNAAADADDTECMPAVCWAVDGEEKEEDEEDEVESG